VILHRMVDRICTNTNASQGAAWIKAEVYLNTHPKFRSDWRKKTEGKSQWRDDPRMVSNIYPATSRHTDHDKAPPTACAYASITDAIATDRGSGYPIPSPNGPRISQMSSKTGTECAMVHISSRHKRHLERTSSIQS